MTMHEKTIWLKKLKNADRRIAFNKKRGNKAKVKHWQSFRDWIWKTIETDGKYLRF